MYHQEPSVDPADFREHARELRKRYGPQPWLTVASGVVGEAYRLAGLTSEEFTELLRAQTDERGRLLLHLRRKSIMRLRAGFDGHEGGISDEDGVLILHLHFRGGSYEERHFASVGGGEITWTEGPGLRLNGRPRSSLLVTGDMDRPAASVFPKLPRCLHPRSIRMRGLTHSSTPFSSEGMMEMKIRPHWETLALMPAEVSAELGLPMQLTLDQIPWMPHVLPWRLGPSTRVERPASAVGSKRPKLTIVSAG